LKYKKKDLTLHELINHVRIEETKSLKDKMDSLYLDSSKDNPVAYDVLTNRDRFKGEDKKNQKSS